MTTNNNSSCVNNTCQFCGGNCCGTITNDPATWPNGDKLWSIAQAVAIAEGANIAGSVPDRSNNPGDLGKGDEHGQATVGAVCVPDAEGAVIHFATKAGGWNALRAKLQNIATYKSAVYSPDWTWYQIASKWAGNSEAWADNVAGALGVDPSTSMNSYLQGCIVCNPCCVCCCGGSLCG